MRERGSLLGRVTSMLCGLVAIGVVTRVAWELLRPALPTLVVLLVLVGILRAAASGLRRW